MFYFIEKVQYIQAQLEKMFSVVRNCAVSLTLMIEDHLMLFMFHLGKRRIETFNMLVKHADFLKLDF